MLTPEQRARIARENGAKSKGPITAEGKARSSRNAIKHGERATLLRQFVPPHSCVLANEDRQAYWHLVDINAEKFRPVDEREAHLVRQITDCEWKLHRAQSLQTALINRELLNLSSQVVSLDPALHNLDTTLAAMESVSHNKAFEVLRKDAAQLHRTLGLLEKRFIFLRKHLPSDQDLPLDPRREPIVYPNPDEQFPLEESPVETGPAQIDSPNEPNEPADPPATADPQPNFARTRFPGWCINQEYLAESEFEPNELIPKAA